MALEEAVRNEVEMAAKADAIRALAAHVHAAQARLALLLGDFLADGSWNDTGDWRSPAHWLGINCGYARGEAEVLTRVATAAPSMPTVMQRAAHGEISLHVAAGAARVATPDNEAKLAEIAASSTPAQAIRVFGDYRTAKRHEDELREPDPDPQPAQPEPEPEFVAFWKTWFDDDGTWRVNGAAPPEIGALLDRLYEAGFKDAERSAASDDTDHRPAAADALRAMADLGLDTADRRRLRDEGDERFLVTVLIDLETLVDGTIRPDSTCRLQSGPHVRPGLVRRLAEEGTLQVLWHRAGIPLKLGREVRLANREQKRALRFRDGGCAIPGCSAEKHLHAHHVEFHPGGAPTSRTSCLASLPFVTTPRSAAIYARISSDQAGTALGVKRQVADCQALAEQLGWVVAEVYEDNDISAYGGKRRPSYERMLADLRDRRRDGVLVYHTDRLTRRPIEVEQFLDVVQTAGVNDVRFVASGGLDIGNGDGLLMLRVLGAVAANESASKSRRQRRKNDEKAAAGVPHGGANRPFAYADDRVTVVPAEAEVLRQAVERFLAGESLRSLTSWLDTEGVTTVSGGPWRTSTLATTLKNPRYAGLRVHRGDIVGPGVWEPIITVEQRERVMARFEQRKTTGRRTPRRYLLSGLLRCGKCGSRLYSSARSEGKDQRTRRYICSSGPDHGGCGKLTVVAEQLEDLVTAAVLYRLDTPELAAALAGNVAEDDQAAELSESLAADKAMLDDLAQMFAAKEIGSREWLAARGPIQERIDDTTRRISQLTRTDTLGGLPGNGAALSSEWTTLSLSRQAAIVGAVVDHAVIGPGRPGARGLDPSRVDLVWKL